MTFIILSLLAFNLVCLVIVNNTDLNFIRKFFRYSLAALMLAEGINAILSHLAR